MSEQVELQEGLVLNLGCGSIKREGCINVDIVGSPDLQHDLEQTPWPWQSSSVRRVFLEFVLEQLGPSNQVFFAVIEELYRVLKPGGLVRIKAAHPRHDSFVNNPCNVRPITGEGFRWLNDHLAVTFEIVRTVHMLSAPWYAKVQAGEISQTQLAEYSQLYNNVIESTVIDLKALK